MRKIIYLLATLSFFFACTEDNGGDTSREKTDGAYLSIESMGGEGGSSDGSGSSSGSGSGSDTTQNPNGIQPGQITAGEWNDLQDWDFWLNLLQKEDFAKMPAYWSFNLENRISVLLKTSTDEPAVGIEVQLLSGSDKILWESKTDNEGKAELWPYSKYGEQTQAGDLKLKIDGKVYKDVIPIEQGINTFVINSYQSPQNKIDIAFVVDATGSMGDELEFLKVELVDVIDKVKNNNPSAAIHLGSVFYRDEGDDYITRKSDFTTNINTTINFIKNQQADGGGDTPEAVHTALYTSIKELQWSSDATSRILFLLLDAPPHYEDQIISQISELVQIASRMGIKIIPITASGIDKETEFLMRYMSIATNGTYVFITNHSGIGGDHLEPSIGEYEVELLNKLLVRLINKYLE